MANEQREELAVVPVPHAEPVAVVLWGSNDPALMVARMGIVASTLASAIRARGLSVRIGPKEYVRVEGWALCGAILGIFPKTSDLAEMRDDDGLFGFRATVELTTRDGGVVGGAMALCTRYETAWADRDANQIASMAQTRAIAKSYRGSLGFIMEMSGFAATPAEEMDGIEVIPPARQQRQEATRPVISATSDEAKTCPIHGGPMSFVKGKWAHRDPEGAVCTPEMTS